MQRKFTRKPKKPAERPSPIINFVDYSQTGTPLERYRKHYLMFEYWNDDLLEALQASPRNEKRIRRSSAEALSELRALEHLLSEELAQRLRAVIDERAAIDHRLQQPVLQDAQAQSLLHLLEPQSRQIHREFFWRQVEERLQEPPAADAAGS